MQHIEQAGVYPGDSACSLPPYNLPLHIQDLIRQQEDIAIELQVVGLMNVQMAVQGEDVFVLEVNPRASRTVPFVSKCRRVVGKGRCSLHGRTNFRRARLYARDRARNFPRQRIRIPFNKFPGVDPILGPEMKSTGEVMGIGDRLEKHLPKPLWVPATYCRLAAELS